MFSSCVESCLRYSSQQHFLRANRRVGRQACALLGAALMLAFRAVRVFMTKGAFTDAERFQLARISADVCTLELQ